MEKVCMVLFWLCMVAVQVLESCMVMDLWGDVQVGATSPQQRFNIRIILCMALITSQMLLFHTEMLTRPFNFLLIPAILLLIYAKRCRQT
ncbi:MAG: hypothetical protein RSD54_07950 [Ruthenibacterium sp.]